MNLRQDRNNSRRVWAAVLLLSVPVMALASKEDISLAFTPDHILAYVTATFLIGVFVMLFLNLIYIFHEEDVKNDSTSQNNRLALVLQTGYLRLWFYIPATRHYIILSETGSYTNEYNPVDFSHFFERDDYETMRTAIFDVCEGRMSSAKVRIRGAKEEDGTQKTFDINVTVSHRSKDGAVERLLCVQHDVTRELARQQQVGQLLMRYHTVFNSSLVDMLYYDNKGVLRDLNEKACETFGVKNRSEVLQGNFLLENNPMFENVDFEKLENTRTSSIINYKNYQEERYKLDEFGLSGMMYYDSTINPIRNENGQLEGIYMSGRNMTEMVESFRRQQAGIEKLRAANRDIREYINKINYSLRVSDVRLINYDPATSKLELSSDVGQTQLHLSQLRCIRIGTLAYRHSISTALNRMDHLTKSPINLTIESVFHDKKQRPIWLLFNMLPILNAEGHVERYFGICRNMTDLVETEQQLAVESRKAQEAELLKQSFLANMSYEIRTPLNTVVGFAELFETEHDEADEPVFVDEIKRNSNLLLLLVNDILYLSRLDAKMIEFNKEFIDFSLIFESHCQMGWSSISSDVTTIIENPYEHLMVEIDQEHVGKVIQMLCAQAVHYTQKGTIRAKYEYRHGELSINIEDTGNGIDATTLPHVFERFVRNEHQKLYGTGLELPIVQSLVEQMGGNVEIQSELGKGTTAWITIPCKATTIEKRFNL